MQLLKDKTDVNSLFFFPCRSQGQRFCCPGGTRNYNFSDDGLKLVKLDYKVLNQGN